MRIYQCRGKQRKEASLLQTVNRKLSAMNKLPMEGKKNPPKAGKHNHKLTPVVTQCLLAVSEETLAELLGKATGTAVDLSI
ncbi:homeobox-leucine zipper protein hox32 [Phtheirospermum japonicum]|uniref:Homeobox-leucine zipper protein hox32 n=1 Tax=Phtheirospermum japonicum TaxID=374723 RepID=A0A830CUI7_9LAMI|nr:homeobox-leucine zipper protein hox32 [Phtheirospermum japonicum]